jgi:hypothetical protein
MKYKLLLVFLLMGTFGCGKQAITRPNIAFQKISSHGVTHFVYIKATEIDNDKKYLDVSKYICDELKACIVIFWDKRANVPFTLPMTDQQANTKIAHYNLNETKNLRRLQICKKDGC